MRVAGNTALISYDLLILRRGAQAAFSRLRDRLLLALAVPLGLLLLARAAAPVAAEMPLALKAALVGLSGFAVAHWVAARLGHLRAHSMLAPHALKARPAAFHAAFWSAPPLLAGLAVFLTGRELAFELGALLAAFAAGAAAALGWRMLRRKLRRLAARRRGSAARPRVPDLELGTRRQRIVRLLIARSGLRQLRIAANLAFFAGAGALLGLVAALRDSGPFAFTMPLAGLAAVLLAGLAIRQHPPLLRYLLFLGIMPTGPALVPLLPLAALLAGFVAAAASLGSIPLLWLAAGAASVLLFLALAALLRGHHYSAKSRQAAEFAIQIDFAMLAAAAFIAPPFAPFLLALRLWMLRRASAALRYSAP
jgi:hypothetical protein